MEEIQSLEITEEEEEMEETFNEEIEINSEVYDVTDDELLQQIIDLNSNVMALFDSLHYLLGFLIGVTVVYFVIKGIERW